MDKDAKIRELDQRVIELENNIRKADAILAEMHAKITTGGKTIEALESRIEDLQILNELKTRKITRLEGSAELMFDELTCAYKHADCMKEENRALRAAIEALYILAN